MCVGVGLSEMLKVENCNVVRRMLFIKNKIYYFFSSYEYFEFIIYVFIKSKFDKYFE